MADGPYLGKMAWRMLVRAISVSGHDATRMATRATHGPRAVMADVPLARGSTWR